LLPAGMAVVKDAGAKTTRYNPISTAIPSSTAKFYHNDRLFVALGARHDISELGINIGQMMGGRVRVMGTAQALTESTLPTPDLYEDIPPVARFNNTRAYIDPDGSGGGAEVLVWAKSLVVNFGNELGAKEYSSVKRNTISDRLATWTMRIARNDLSDFNYDTLADGGTIITARMRVYSVGIPGLYAEIGIRGQIESHNEVDIEGDHGVELSGPCIPSDTGGDEFYLLFGDDTV
jgi:hypothetical protein